VLLAKAGVPTENHIRQYDDAVAPKVAKARAQFKALLKT
jgi:hypothetical protein